MSPVDLRAIMQDLGHRRPREQAAAIACDPFADGIVIGVEQEGISRIEGPRPGLSDVRMKVSKNHDIARCRLVGLASGIDLTT